MPFSVEAIRSGRGIWANSYFSYFAFLGIYLAYLPVLLSAHYDNAQIGLISSVFIITRIIAPVFWGHIADTRAFHVPLLRIKSILSGVSLVLMLNVWKDFHCLIVVTFLFGFFWSGTLPILEAVTVERQSGDSHQYNRIRLWGSVGFIFAILLMGYCLDEQEAFFGAMSSESTLISIALFLAMSLIIICYLFLPKVKFKSVENVSGSVLKFFKHRITLIFLSVAILMHMSHGVFYAFFSLHLESFNYSKTMISVYWVVGVIAEIFVFIYIQRWLKCWSAYAILVICLIAAIIRWLLIGFYVESSILVFIAQLLHSLTFGAFHVISMQFIRSSFPGQYQARAQSVFTMMCYGLGASIGTYLGGLVMQVASAELAFSLSVFQVVCALAITLTFLSSKSL